MDLVLLFLAPAVFAIVVSWVLFAGLRRQKAADRAKEEAAELTGPAFYLPDDPAVYHGDDKEGMDEALGQWLRDPQIVSLFRRRLGASPEYLQRLLDGLDALNKYELKAVMVRLLGDYTVRRVIAKRIVKEKGLPHARVMLALLEWSRPKENA
jgi:hypothetical protein